MKWSPLILCVLVVIATAFQSVDTSAFDIHPRAKSYFMQKTTKYAAQLRAKCRSEAMTEARARVDSILLARRILVDIDSFYLGHRPSRPAQPQLRLRDEQVDVVPIFDSLIYADSTKLDSMRLDDSDRDSVVVDSLR